MIFESSNNIYLIFLCLVSLSDMIVQSLKRRWENSSLLFRFFPMIHLYITLPAFIEVSSMKLTQGMNSPMSALNFFETLFLSLLSQSGFLQIFLKNQNENLQIFDLPLFVDVILLKLRQDLALVMSSSFHAVNVWQEVKKIPIY